MALKCKACGKLGAKRIGQVPGRQSWHWFGACGDNSECILKVKAMIADRIKTHREYCQMVMTNSPWLRH